jgi:multidrug efflux pump subunit AcrA (membrane-fusion protein)
MPEDQHQHESAKDEDKSYSHRLSENDENLAVQDAMSRPPAWILRSGMSALIVALLLILVLTGIIEYPDTIEGKITVIGTNPPVGLVAQQSGYLELLVSEKQRVGEGDLLAIIHSPVKSDVAFAIKAALKQLPLSLSDPTERLDIQFPQHDAALGMLQNAYSEFIANWKHHRFLLEDQYPTRMAALLRGQLENRQEQIKQMQAQVANVERDSFLAAEGYGRIQKMQKLSSESLSPANLQRAERDYLAECRVRDAVLNSFYDAKISAVESEKQIEEMNSYHTKELRVSAANLNSSVQRLLGAIDSWDSEYVLRAPVAGNVCFYDYWAGQQYVTAGKNVFIIATQNSPLAGRMPVYGLGIGKIKPGQTVRIYLDDYPHHEFGLIRGKVENVSLVSHEGAHLVSVSLHSPLKTSYGHVLPFKQVMLGSASVVLEKRSLLGRIFSGFRDAFKTEP